MAEHLVPLQFKDESLSCAPSTPHCRILSYIDTEWTNKYSISKQSALIFNNNMIHFQWSNSYLIHGIFFEPHHFPYTYQQWLFSLFPASSPSKLAAALFELSGGVSTCLRHRGTPARAKTNNKNPLIKHKGTKLGPGRLFGAYAAKKRAPVQPNWVGLRGMKEEGAASFM